MSFQDYADDLERELNKKAFDKRYIAALVAVIVIVVGAIGYHFYASARAEASSFEISKSTEAEEKSKVYVHVVGAVNFPGLIELDEGSRVAAAIDAAGGAAEDADLSSVNLAEIVEDGQQIVVASTSETEGTSTQAGVTNGKVNINTADSETLQTISGIGPSKAQKIIAYREANGRFKKVDDLTNVSGFGEKTLEAIRDQICV